MAREVFDVTGAGDTVIATLAAMTATGMRLRDAVPIANRAGGIVVGKFGTATVNYGELFAKELLMKDRCRPAPPASSAATSSRASTPAASTRSSPSTT